MNSCGSYLCTWMIVLPQASLDTGKSTLTSSSLLPVVYVGHKTSHVWSGTTHTFREQSSRGPRYPAMYGSSSRYPGSSVASGSGVGWGSEPSSRNNDLYGQLHAFIGRSHSQTMSQLAWDTELTLVYHHVVLQPNRPCMQPITA